jgi:hypothetical protein
MPGLLPEVMPDVIFPEVTDKVDPATTPQGYFHEGVATKEQSGWLHRRRNRIILAVVVAALIILGVVVGVVVSLTQRGG